MSIFPKVRNRRPTTRTYHVGIDKWVTLSKEWSMKFGCYLYYVYDESTPPKTLFKGRFAEARQFVRDYTP